MTYTLTEITSADLQVLAEALGNLPFKVAAPLFNKLQAQIGEQDKNPETIQFVAPPTANDPAHLNGETA